VQLDERLGAVLHRWDVGMDAATAAAATATSPPPFANRGSFEDRREGSGGNPRGENECLPVRLVRYAQTNESATAHARALTTTVPQPNLSGDARNVVG
jgi:hypothetical protein